MSHTHGVRYATVRDAGEYLHIECRFENGEKYAAVHVDAEKPELAHWIASNLVAPTALDIARARLTQAEHTKDFLIEQLLRIHNLVGPEPIEANGKIYEFRDPNAAETLAELSRRIRGIGDALRAEGLGQ